MASAQSSVRALSKKSPRSAALLTYEHYELRDRQEFIRRVRSGQIGLPYKRGYTDDTRIREKFANLVAFDSIEAFAGRVRTDLQYTLSNCDFKKHELLYGDKPTLLCSANTDYDAMGAISDMFQEHNRLRARVINAHKSAHDFFYSSPQVIADDCMERHSIITPFNAREALYWQASECSAFNPLVMTYFIHKYSASSVLDFSSGWGDRLIAALASGIRYVGVDPNTALFEPYREMIRFFAGEEPRETADCAIATKRINMICAPIQSALLPRNADGRAETFDMVFTSPPYWNLEDYCGAGKVVETSEEEWLWSFLWPALDIAMSRLNIGGHLALALNQQRKQTYIRKMIEHMRDRADAEYLGVISYTDSRIRNPQPVWIWKKTSATQLMNTETKSSEITMPDRLLYRAEEEMESCLTTDLLQDLKGEEA